MRTSRTSPLSLILAGIASAALLACSPSGGKQTSGSAGLDGALVTFVSPTGGATVGGATTVTLQTASSVALVNLYLDGNGLGQPAIASGTATLQWDTTSVADGAHELKAIAYDGNEAYLDTFAIDVTVQQGAASSAGSSSGGASGGASGGSSGGSSTGAMQVSDSNPVVFTSPSDESSVSGTVQVTTAVNSAVAFANFYVDGNGVGGAGNDTGSSISFHFDSTVFSSGSHSLSAIVYDAASQYIGGAQISITIGSGRGSSSGSGGSSGSGNTGGSGGSSSGSSSGGSTTPSSSAVPPGATLTFDEEFTGLSVSDHNGGGTTWFSNTIACCMDDTSGGLPATMAGIDAPAGQNPFSLAAGGGLDIRLQKTNNVWYSGVLASVDQNGNGFSQTYGYFEVMAKLPTGQGTWPSFWLNSTARLTGNYPGYYNALGEVDVFEEYGQNYSPANFYTTLHDWQAGTTPDGPYNVSEPDVLDGNFHTFGMLWTQSTTTFYYDGSPYYQVSTPSIMQGQPYFLILDLGLGGGWPTDQTPQQNDFIVKYVRAYQLP